MNRIIKYLSAVLAVLLLMQASVTPVVAADAFTEVPPTMAQETTATLPEEASVPQTISALEETVAQPQETLPQETVPAATEPVETEPAETQLEETAVEPTESEEIVRKIYNSVPLYFQNDYPDTMFGVGTVATSGCSITSLAMVATYLTGHEYLPDELAGYFGGRAENNVARMEYGIDQMKLPCRKAENWHVVMDGLNKGKIAILLVDEKSIFTDSQHFLVLTGVTEDGLVLVNDSEAKNYEKWDLKDKLITGFPESDLWKGYNGAWVFDPAAMPADPFLYHEEEVYVEPRYVGVTLTMDEREMLARMVWVESRGEPLEGQQAVAEVVLNRLVAPNFQDSIESIIMAQDQFNSARFLDKAEPNQTQYEAVEHALKGPYILPINTVYFSRQTPQYGTYWGRIGGHTFTRQWLD